MNRSMLLRSASAMLAVTVGCGTASTAPMALSQPDASTEQDAAPAPMVVDLTPTTGTTQSLSLGWPSGMDERVTFNDALRLTGIDFEIALGMTGTANGVVWNTQTGTVMAVGTQSVSVGPGVAWYHSNISLVVAGTDYAVGFVADGDGGGGFTVPYFSNVTLPYTVGGIDVTGLCSGGYLAGDAGPTCINQPSAGFPLRITAERWQP